MQPLPDFLDKNKALRNWSSVNLLARGGTLPAATQVGLPVLFHCTAQAFC